MTSVVLAIKTPPPKKIAAARRVTKHRGISPRDTIACRRGGMKSRWSPSRGRCKMTFDMVSWPCARARGQVRGAAVREGVLFAGAGVGAAQRILEGPGDDPVALPALDAEQHEAAAVAVEAQLLRERGRAGEALVVRDLPIRRLRPRALAGEELLQIVRGGWHHELRAAAVGALEGKVGAEQGIHILPVIAGIAGAQLLAERAQIGDLDGRRAGWRCGARRRRRSSAGCRLRRRWRRLLPGP